MNADIELTKKPAGPLDRLVRPSCAKCAWLRKYVSENGLSLTICECDGPEEQETGLFWVCMIDVEQFDNSNCLAFKAA